MKRIYFFILLAVVFVVLPGVVHAEYVLPYPSYMPGNKLYAVSRIFDRLKSYWYWGNLGQFRYHLALSDKYLVEAKTLFEYKQYLLGAQALERSDKEFRLLKQVDSEVILAHEGVLRKLLLETPETIEWKPEKIAPSTIALHDLLQHSLSIRTSAGSL